MKAFRKGKILDGYRVVSLRSKAQGRMEYAAVKTGAEKDGEYRTVVYDLTELPAEYVWASCEKQAGGRMPFERHFLEKRPLKNYPAIVEEGGDGELQWIIVKIQEGLSVRDYVRKNGKMPLDKALKVAINICSYLETISCFDEGKAGHYNVTPDTVRILDDGDSPQTFLEGFGYLSFVRDSVPFTRPIDESSFYLAPELFIGCPSIKADVYGVCLILFLLLTGQMYPWSRESLCPYEKIVSGQCDRDSFVVGMGRLWNTTPNLSEVHPRKLKTIIYNGISTNPNKRTESIIELQEQLEQVLATEVRAKVADGESSSQPGSQGGFSVVAGLEDLKKQMTRKFIMPIRHRKLARAYKITPPNGCLLYGPPGCGKTFVASKIAEEAGIQCRVFRPSDIASIYVHGGQAQIKSLFEYVRKHAPIMVCFDEADAFVSDRTKPGNEQYAGEVNEFLTQLNNAAKEGVYVFLMTNNPGLLDPAVLRTGRIDEKLYIPLPDKAGREEFFRIRFREIPTTGEISYSALADQTEGMTYSDLDYIVTESCREVFQDAVELNMNKVLPISQSVVEGVIAVAPRSVSPDEIRRYETLREEFEERTKGLERKRIGFV